ncbi:MAG: hypothetical protein QXR34_06295, partial [Saccharolobus sp.]
YPIKIDKNMIITNKGNILKYQILYNTGSLKRLYKLLGISNDSLGFVSAISLLLIGKSKNKKDEWNVYLSGDRADSFSTIIKLNNVKIRKTNGMFILVVIVQIHFLQLLNLIISLLILQYTTFIHLLISINQKLI